MTSYPSDSTRDRSNWDYPSNYGATTSTTNPDTYQPFQTSPSYPSDTSSRLDNRPMGLKDFAEGTTPSSGFDKDKSGGFSRPADATQSHKRHAISYEDFIKNKPGALLFFSKHPDTQELFSRQDAEEASNLFQTYNRMILFVYFGSAFAAYTADNFLRYKNLIYGMTYRRTIFKLLFKYWLIPTSVAGIANNLFLQDIYIPKIERIANNYSFSEPVFREAFDKGMPKNADKSRRNE